MSRIKKPAGMICRLSRERAALLAFYRRHDGVLRVGGVPLVKGLD